MADLRQWIARKLLMWAYLIDRDGKFEFHAGCYKFERGWKQPTSTNDMAAR